MNKCKWTFFDLWNESLISNVRSATPTPRERMWATEIGRAFIDRYLKMKGITYTNPPNPRSLRKFEAGNIWEAIIGYVLRRAGILIDSQEWIRYQYEGLLPVTGKLDYMAGGKPDYEKALSGLKTEFSWLTPFISKATENIVKSLQEKYPDGLEKIILEVKTCSSFMFEFYERGKANPMHKLQGFHYLKAKDMREAHIVYISKDDARIVEIGIFNPSPLEDIYRRDIEKMTNYFRSNTEPPKEKPIIYDDILEKFSANWKMGYSVYLTKLYGLKNQKEFDDKYKPTVAKWNRILKRIKEGKKITDKNKEALAQIEEMGFGQFIK